MSVSSKPILICSMVAAVLLASPLCGLAQEQRPTVNSLFGPRAMGVSINPGVRTFSGGISRTPAGNFVGLSGPGGVAFNPPRVQSAVAGSAPMGSQVRTGLGSQIQQVNGETPQNAVSTMATVPAAAEPGLQPESQEAVDSSSAFSGSSAAPPPRVRYGAGDSQPGSASVASAAHLSNLLQHNPHVKSRSPITVAVRNGTTILAGRVATERDRRVAEMLARLEPGVGRVQNELTVESPDSKPYFSVPGR